MNTININNELIKRLIDNPTFLDDYTDIYFDNVRLTLPGEKPRRKVTDEKIIQLLESASILASSIDYTHRSIAYRIAISVINLYAKDRPNIVNVAHVILGRLGNFPTIEYMYNSIAMEKRYNIPYTLLFELLAHEDRNTILIGSKKVILTDFQQKLWDLFENNQLISISAPTSAGKSFALQNFLITRILEEHVKFIIYLVPTRALISQVSNSLSISLKGSNIQVSTIPETPINLEMEKGIYVLTQERAHVLLNSIENKYNIDIIVVDEAQTIGSGARGILLQVVLEKLINRYKRAKYIFGSPFSKNPKYFNYLFEDEVIPVPEKESPVAQNILDLEVPKDGNKSATLKIYTGSEFKELKKVKLSTVEYDDKSILAYISYYFGKGTKNIVYVGSPAACEEIAYKITQWIQEEREQQEDEKIVPEELGELSTFIREHIHEDYWLADMIEDGVAFHFGHMPTLLRKAIEDCFINHSELKYLVCTSTLLHGVNLPAKNMFMLKPSEGDQWLTARSEPMSGPSFWNLAGRAGRLGKDFEGNVFLINKLEWKEDPLDSDKEQTIVSSFYQNLINKQEEILNAARADNVDGSNYDATIDSILVKLYTDYKNDRIDEVFIKSPEPIDEKFSVELKKALGEIKIDLPDDIIEKNIGIPLLNQQKMFEYINKKIEKNEAETLIPEHPGQNAYQSYVRLFSRYEICFDGKEKATRAPRRLAAIAQSWMRGERYPIIIKNQQKHKQNSRIPVIIRETMETIEIDIRFKLVQRTRCYIDILNYAFEKHKIINLANRIPALPLYLEIGACSKTMVSLIGLGFSRTTAGLINSISNNHNMDREKVIKWLNRQNWDSIDLPKVCINEAKSILGE